MVDSVEHSFGTLLRRYRLEQGLSQEELAERAQLSVQAIGALERGARRAPHRDTVDLLADALGLAPAARQHFHAAVSRRRGPPRRPRPAPSPRLTPATSFVGRQHEQAVVRRLLEQSRLVSLVGTGGVGKTRLATEVAAALADDDPGAGVRFVELGALADPDLVPQAVAQALNVREQAGRPLLDTLVEALADQPRLLVLDNCEHLRPAVGALAERLLRGGPGLRLLATSREALGIVGETVWWVPSLALPEPPGSGAAGSGSAVQRVQQAEAGQLFCERAVAAHPGFVLTEANAAAVATICRRLDGIPLAIELAAARARIFTPEQIAARLDARFRLLTRGAAEAPDRQQTLEAALDWSYALLSEPERRLLERLSVFAGGCTIEGAEAVAVGEAVEADALVDLLTSLVEKSLLVVEYRAEAARYRLLETVRAYAAERLTAAGQATEVRDRQKAWAIDLTAAAYTERHATTDMAWLRRLEAEHDNIRAALGWALTGEDAISALRLSVATSPLWQTQAHFHEGRTWLDRALACPGDASLSLRAQALNTATFLAYLAGDPDGSMALAREYLAAARALDRPRDIARAQSAIGRAAFERRDIATAEAAWAEALRLHRELDEPEGIAVELGNLANIATYRRDFTTAVDLCQQHLDGRRALGKREHIVHPLRLLGVALLDAGDFRQARPYVEEGLALAEELGDRWNRAGLLRLLGHLAVCEGDTARAAALHEQSLAQHREVGNRFSIAEGNYYLARVWLRLGRIEAAERLLDESRTLCQQLRYDALLTGVLRSLGEAARLRGDIAQAERRLAKSLAGSEAMGEPVESAATLEALAATALAAGDPERAAGRLGAATALRARSKAARRLHLDLPVADTAAAARAALGDAGYTAAFEAGAAGPDEPMHASLLAGSDGGDRA